MSVSSHEVVVWAAIGLLGLVVYTAVRYGLMAVFSSAARPA
jgi:hypothetical protein